MKRVVALLCVVTACSIGASALRAQTPEAACAPASAAPSAASVVHHWGAPLDRTVTFSPSQAPLEQALKRVAAAARLNLSYSSDILPPGRVACLSSDHMSAGDVLTLLLHDTGLDIVIAGPDQVVIVRARAQRAQNDSATMHVFPMGRVLATSNASCVAADRTPTFAVTILDASSSGWRQGASLMEILNTNVPGMWMWMTPAGITANFGSTRGASSFGIAGPKILIDGIELANPLLLTRVSLDAVDRIEIIRGPQGSARYGADALNGVTNIIMRHDASESAAPRIRAASTLGMAATRYADDGAVTQDHTLRLQIGSAAHSVDFDVGLGSIGAYAPGASTTHASADASMRIIAEKTVLTGTLRYLSQSVDTAGSGTALLALPDPGFATAFADAAVTEALKLREYTAGINATYAHSDRWTHSLVAGIDGYTLGGVAFDSLAPFSRTDATLRDAGSRATRLTLRGNSAVRLGAPRLDATLTFTGDHTRISQREDNLPVYPAYTGDGDRDDHDVTYIHAPGSARVTEVRTSTGLSAELSGTVWNHLLLTGAMRLEHDAGGTAGDGRAATLPMLGAAYRTAIGTDAEIKIRSSYGKGVRWPALTGLHPHMQLASITLEPEQQSGYDAGVDLYLAHFMTLQATRFDQTATGLAQQVTLPALERGRGPGGPRYGIEMQNVGAISNDGWELQGSIRHASLSLASALTFLDSRVLRVATSYTGDLRSGDRPLAVPARTISVTASVARPLWSASVTAYRAADWVNYDRIAMAGASTDSIAPYQLRRFWRTYDGFTHVGFNASRTIRGFVLTFGGSNLLNKQIGEPDNVTIVPGRTYSVGLRAVF
jgi:iron complex outermembrane receptor protein